MNTSPFAKTFLSLMVVGCVGAPVLALEVLENEEGRLIQIGPEVDAQGQPDGARGWLRGAQPPVRVPVSRFWIGISGGPIPPELRAHLTLPADQGVLVRSVEPGSPGEKEGVQLYDVIARVNGDPIKNMRQLAEIVGDQGEMKGRLTIELLRAGRTETVWVTPEKRPIEPAPAGNQFFNWNQGQRGVAITTHRQNGGPTVITVRRGNESWRIEGDDPESLAALPDDLRPQIQRMLQQQNQRQALFPNAGDVFAPFVLEGVDPGQLFNDNRLRVQIDQLEQRAEALRRQLIDPQAAPEVPPPAGEDAGEPMELEIPAE